MHRVNQRGFDDPHSRGERGNDDAWLSARAAAAALDVKLSTQYAYASRGAIESRPGERGRPRRYAKSDVERLRARRDARAGHGAVAAGALRFGEPVLDSSITDIGVEGPIYRGTSAVDLAARGASFESVAELLWTGASIPTPPAWPRAELGFDPRRAAKLLSKKASPLDGVWLALSLRRAASAVRVPLGDADEIAEARAAVPILAAAAGLAADPDRVKGALARTSVAAIVASALGVDERDRTLAGIDRALVLSADHELNVSAFTARIAASAATDLLGCLSAALAVASGARHGGVSDRLETLLDGVADASDVRAFVASKLCVDEPIPGFGHRLYPDGDPRAAHLLERVRRGRAPGGLEPRRRALLALIDELARRRYSAPTIDVALVALRLALGLPRGAAALVFAVGRIAGWVAHVLEQRSQGALLRPRARFVGPSP